jgi:diguanylate cyclase (GGDEF)-like protein
MPDRVAPSPAAISLSPQRLTCASLALVGLICLLCVGVLVSAYRDALRNTEKSMRNLSIVVARDIERNIELSNLQLQSVIDGLHQPRINQYPDPIRRMILFNPSYAVKYLSAACVTNAAGEVILDGGSSAPVSVNLAQRDFFAVHQHDAKAGLYLSKPFQVQPGSGPYEIALSRRWNAPDGSFAGVVFATLRLDYFYQLLQDINVGGSGHVVLYLTDGTILMDYPTDIATLGHNIRGSKLFHTLSASGDGFVTGPSPLDSVMRLRAFRHIDGLPLILTVGVSVDDMLLAWREKAWVIVIYTSLLGIATVLLSFLLVRELRRRQELESELLRLARTDSLTQLGNRRLFDESLKREWERAARLRKPLSLMMLDIDWFKKYNDLYGHPAGDVALRAVAVCIAEGIHRPTDICARYGGEEFIVVLPETNLSGTFHVAEKIRKAVEKMALVHHGSALGVVTVSVGLASLVPRQQDDAQILIDAADEAMYRAKQAGRNRVLAQQNPAEERTVLPAYGSAPL